MNSTPRKTATAKATKYLTFLLKDAHYGIPVLRVQEIVGYQPITSVPNLPEFFRGVINLRGKIITVIDLRAKFNLGFVEEQARTCIIIIQIEHGEEAVTIGALVDGVSSVYELEDDDIQPPPGYSGAVDTSFLQGIAKVGDDVVLMLDLDGLLSGDQLSRITDVQPAVDAVDAVPGADHEDA